MTVSLLKEAKISTNHGLKFDVRTKPGLNIFAVAVKILFILLLWKISGIRVWPHAYLGEPYAPFRATYYTETAISLCAILALFFHPDVFKAEIKRHLLLYSYLFYILLIYIFASKNITTFALTLNFWGPVLILPVFLNYYNQLEFKKVLIYFAIVTILINAASIAVPSRSMMLANFSGFFRGLTAHRNDLSQLMVICSFILLCSSSELRAFIRWPLILSALVMIGFAGSVQGILLTMGGFAIFYAFVHRKIVFHPYFIYTFITFMAIAVVIYTFSLDEFLALFGRDSSFTGRDRIWDLSEYLIMRMPWYGYGVGSVATNSPFTPPNLLHTFGLGTLFSSAHNSYLEAFLSFGWIGGILFLLIAVHYTIQIIKKLLNSDDVNDMKKLSALLLFVCIVGGFTASEKFFYPERGWFSFILLIYLSYGVRGDAHNQDKIPQDYPS